MSNPLENPIEGIWLEFCDECNVDPEDVARKMYFTLGAVAVCKHLVVALRDKNIENPRDLVGEMAKIVRGAMPIHDDIFSKVRANEQRNESGGA